MAKTVYLLVGQLTLVMKFKKWLVSYINLQDSIKVFNVYLNQSRSLRHENAFKIIKPVSEITRFDDFLTIWFHSKFKQQYSSLSNVILNQFYK